MKEEEKRKNGGFLFLSFYFLFYLFFVYFIFIGFVNVMVHTKVNLVQRSVPAHTVIIPQKSCPAVVRFFF